MSEAHDTKVQGTPWHLWVIGVVALLWSGMGAMDFVMTQTQNEQYMGQFTPEQLEFFYGFPSWVVALWAVAVFGGVLGALLLLLRKPLAASVFLASLVAMLITTVRNYLQPNGLELLGGTEGLAFTAVIFLLALAFVLYARAMHKKGVLV